MKWVLLIDIQDRVAALQSIGIDTINRLTIAGHGDYNGLLLSSGHRLPRNVSKLKENPITLFIDMIKANGDGFRTINLISCYGARRFGGEPSLAECISSLGRGLIVRASPGLSYAASINDEVMDVHSASSLASPVLDTLARLEGSGHNKIINWLKKVFWRGAKSVSEISIGGQSYKDSSGIMRLGG